MSHWFDDFTKNLAGAGPIPRRSFLQLVGAAIGTRLVEGIPLAGAIASISFNRAIAASECAWRTAGTAKINEVSLNQNGISFHRQLSYDVAQQTGTFSASVTKGDALIVKIDINAKRGGLVTGSEIYGPDVQGAKKATITSRDGQSFEGQLDGRAFTVRDHQMVFADGQPAPNITVEPNLRTTIDTLLAESRQIACRVSGCPVARRSAPPANSWLARTTRTGLVSARGPRSRLRPMRAGV